MRTGGYTLHQSLTPEAANIAKQAVNLARRRGHAQVTPLHVATIMFASSNSLFKRACLQSHSHPLQTKALELCFNVALNRLPTSTTSNPILISPQYHNSYPPSLSNALVAAFKRAQAHQRRGSSENQQPILALKIDVEQLVVSVLDDPSVSRVMREAGFSSTQVKSKVEKGVSDVIRSHTSDFLDKGRSYGGNMVSSRNSLLSSDFLDKRRSYDEIMGDFKTLSFSKVPDYRAREEDDVMSIISSLIDKKTRNLVIVGECLVTVENVVRGVIDKFDIGEVSGKTQSLRFISVPLSSLRYISKEEFETKLEELRSLVKSFASKGVVLYLGDLKWICEFRSKNGDQRVVSDGGGGFIGECYSAVEEMVMELMRLSSGVGGYGKVLIMGSASFSTYMKCKIGNPSLESLWELHPFTIPIGSLALGLSLESDLNNHGRSKAAVEEGSSSWFHGKANCTNSNLPMWLQKYKEDKITRENIHHQEEEKAMDLCSKWNSNLKPVHKLQFSSVSSASSTNSISSNDSKLHIHGLLNWQSNFEPNTSLKEQKFFLTENEEEPELDHKPVLLSNPNSSPNSASSSEASRELGDLLIETDLLRFKEQNQNQENIEILSKALEKVVPWQKHAIPEIVNTILKCRSRSTKSESWLYFSGLDSEGKEKIAKEIAKIIFGSQDNFFNICSKLLSKERSSDSCNHEEVSNKRKRNEEGKHYFDRFVYEVNENPSRVFFIKDVEQFDSSSQMSFKNAMESGYCTLEDGDLVLFKDAIIIFSRDNDDYEGIEEIKKPRCSLDLNLATYDYEDDVSFLRFVDKMVVFKV